MAHTLTQQQTEDIEAIAAIAISELSPRQRIAIIVFEGRKYRAVKQLRGFQVQSSDMRRLILQFNFNPINHLPPRS